LSKKTKKGNCVFCNGTGLTKQHVWPDWLKNVIPRDNNQHSQFLTHVSLKDPELVVVQPDVLVRQGHAGTRKIRNVCASCNNGWMSKLEGDVKSILTSLILNDVVRLGIESQKNISAWVVMTTIMQEYTDLKTQAIPAIHRKYLMENGIPPEGWEIWIGRYRGALWNSYRFRHHGFLLQRKNNIDYSVNNNNTQATTSRLGELIVYATSSTLEGVNLDIADPIKNKLRRIWPSDEMIIELPLPEVINDIEANTLSDTLFNRYM
jgi:hypothetical protein